MNYVKHYNFLIDRAKNRILNCYSETHHIIPKCLGGSDEKSNLVELTAEEHFVAHQLLVKIYPGNYDLLHAAQMMTTSNRHHDRSKNKLYGWLRKQLAEETSRFNPMFIEEIKIKHKQRVKETQTKELRAKRSKHLSNKNPLKSDELRLKQSLLMKLRMQNPEFKQKMMKNLQEG